MENDFVETEEDAEFEEVKEAVESEESEEPAKKQGGKKHHGAKKHKAPPKALFTLTSTNSDGVSSYSKILILKNLFSKTQRNKLPSLQGATKSSSVTTTDRLLKVMKVKSSEIQKMPK